MILLPHLILLLVWIYQNTSGNKLAMASLMVSLALIYMVTCTCLHIMPLITKRFSSLRLKILQGGKYLLKFCFYSILSQIAFYLIMSWIGWDFLPQDESGIVILLIDLIFCCVWSWPAPVDVRRARAMCQSQIIIFIMWMRQRRSW